MHGAYRVLILAAAEREMLRLSRNNLKHITARILRLADNLRPPGCKKLTEGNGYRVRQCEFRTLYLVDDKERTVVVYAVGHRKKVHR